MSEKKDYSEYGLTKEIVRHYLSRIAWRRQTQLEQKENFDEKYPEDVLTAFLVSGIQYFDKQIVLARRMELVGFKPYQSFANGQAQLFHPRIPGRRYLIGADCATGKQIGTDTDYAAAALIDLETGEDMAGYHARVRPEDFAQDLADLGTYYNNAVIAVERTGDGGTCILALQGDCKYGAIYSHREWWKRRKNTRIMEFEGFPTTVKTRPVALNKLNAFIMDFPELIWDRDFLDECITFVRNEKGIPAAAPGAHDDRVSARWIAYYVRLVLLGYYDPLSAASEKYTSSGRMVTAGVSPNV